MDKRLFPSQEVLDETEEMTRRLFGADEYAV